MVWLVVERGLKDQAADAQLARAPVTNGQATIEDLGSKNGTVGGRTEGQKPVVLEEGAQVRVGSVTMTFRVLDALPSTLTQRRAR